MKLNLLLINRPREDEKLSWPCWLTYTADVWPTKWSSVQLAVRRRTGKVRRSKTSVLPLCYAANCVLKVLKIVFFSLWNNSSSSSSSRVFCAAPTTSVTSVLLATCHQCALILIETSALYKLFTYLLTSRFFVAWKFQTQSLALRALRKRKPQETQALALASSQSSLPLLRPSIPIGWSLRFLRENFTQQTQALALASSQSSLPLLRPSIPIGWSLRLLRENFTQQTQAFAIDAAKKNKLNIMSLTEMIKKFYKIAYYK